MTTIRCLAAVAGLLVLACCTRVENTHLSSPVLPMQEPTHATQAPVLDRDNVLHVGAAAGPAVDALPPAAHHGGASVHYGELPNVVTRTELVAYLQETRFLMCAPVPRRASTSNCFPTVSCCDLRLTRRLSAPPKAPRRRSSTRPCALCRS